MDKFGFLKKLRMFLADPAGKIWGDDELLMYLEEALYKYCKDAQLFTGSFDFYPDAEGKYHYPDDFVSFMTGWNTRGDEITESSASELFYRKNCDINRTGEVRYIYNDLESYGSFMLYPVPADKQNRHDITLSAFLGEVVDEGFGVFVDEEYGTTLSVDIFNFAGTVFYRKTGTFEDIKDHMSVIYCAMSLAYAADSEFGNSDSAAYWNNVYKKRIAFSGNVIHDNSGRGTAVNYY